MLKKLVILIGIVSIVTAFRFSIWLAWGVLGIVSGGFLIAYIAFHLKNLERAKDLSPEAQKVFKKFGYLYVFPNLDDDISEATDKFAWAGVILAVAGCFYEFWWGVVFGAMNLAIMKYISYHFNKSHYILEYKDVVAHDEILDYLEHKHQEEEEKREQQKAA